MTIDTTTATDAASIDPTTIELPAKLGERVCEAFGFPTRPRTYGAWAEGIVTALDDEHGQSLSTDDLCDTGESPHSATLGGETTHYVCAQDPLVVGLLTDRPVTVASTPPNRTEPVRIEFDGDGAVTTDPAGALLSFGIGEPAESPVAVTPEVMYGLVCPHGHAFPDDEAYEEWAERTDAVTDVLSVPAGIAVMAALIDVAGVGGLD